MKLLLVMAMEDGEMKQKRKKKGGRKIIYVNKKTIEEIIKENLKLEIV